ncbi:hypothetical protein G6F31_014476 [Rhizopus arrhizus]|nr:hypothetical protein G6F31_014476 [Rhizopus arrhizus]
MWLAAELAVHHVELEQVVARHQRHLRKLAHVPGADHQPARIGVALDLVQQPLHLVDRTAIGGRPAAPLLAVDRAEIAFLVGPLVPDAHLVVLQVADVGIALQEPQQLVDDRAQVQLLGGDQREAVVEVEAHLPAEHAAGAGAGAVALFGAVFQHMRKQVQHRRAARHRQQHQAECDQRQAEDLATGQPVEGHVDAVVRHAHELDGEAEQAVHQCEQATDQIAVARLGRHRPQHYEHHQPFQERFIQLRGMAGELVQRAAGELRLQGRVVQLVQRRRQAGREHHAPAAVGVLAPQLGTDEVADTAKAQAQRHQRRHEIHGVEEVQRVLARPPPAGAEHAQQAAPMRPPSTTPSMA